MTRARIAGGALAITLVLIAVAAGYRALHRDGDRGATAASPPTTPQAVTAPEQAQGFLHGRVTTVGGAILEGRLRWGGDQEAFWGDYFNGARSVNAWLAHVPPERRPRERRPIEILGIEMPRRIFGIQIDREREVDLRRLFMARFGDLARIEATGREVRVTLKSGTVADLDRFEASDFDDGVRVWDGRRGVVDLDSLQVRAIELLPTGQLEAAPHRLHGTVSTRHGVFTGFVQWDREECVGSDALDGRTADGDLRLRFDSIRSIARHGRDSAQVTLLDGRQIVLSDASDVAHDNRGIYVDDRRYGRVLVSWDAFERVEFSPGGSGPAYGDFPPGRPLTGTVTARAGRRLSGRLVFDLDESETTETLDAPSRGVDYTIPLGLIASIVTPVPEQGAAGRARVALHQGGELQLERSGDLGEGNAGILVFAAGRPGAEFLPWPDVERIDFDRAPAMYPPFGGQ